MALPSISASGLTIKVEGQSICRLALWSPTYTSNATKGPHAISDVADLKLTTTVTNTSDSTLTLVNDPSGVLSSNHPTERHNVVHSSGAEPKFKGVRVKFSPEKAAELGRVTVLQPGQSVTIDHDCEQGTIWTSCYALTRLSVRDLWFHPFWSGTIHFRTQEYILRRSWGH